MYTLYYAPDNASMIIRLALDEAGLPYRTQLLDRQIHEQDGADYRKLNPSGLIPTLITPHGPISETAACLLWLADTHPEANLAPPHGTPLRVGFLKWLFFLSNTGHADLIQILYPARYAAPEGMAGHAALLRARMTQHYALLNEAATTVPELFAPPSMLTLYIMALLRWSVLYPCDAGRWFDIRDYPALHALALLQEPRAATQIAITAEGLGQTPFSNPQVPAPPEGSAT
jgi:glutathione S-transferase